MFLGGCYWWGWSWYGARQVAARSGADTPRDNAAGRDRMGCLHPSRVRVMHIRHASLRQRAVDGRAERGGPVQADRAIGRIGR